MTSTCNPVDDIITHAADLVDAALSLVHNRLAPPPNRDTTARLIKMTNTLQDASRLIQTSSVVKSKFEAEISALKSETQRFTESVNNQLREWKRQQEHQRADDEDPTHTARDGLFPVDVIGVIATFLPSTTKDQGPLMLVNHAWFEGVAGQDGMNPNPHINWPYAALRLRDPSMLWLEGKTDTWRTLPKNCLV